MTVSIVTQTCVRPDRAEDFARWQGETSTVISTFPDFIEQRLTPPNPPLQVDWVINGLGPDYVLERSIDPLTQSLLKSGMIAADSLQLGLRTGEHGACIDRHGQVSERLFYLGPMLRADHWETTGAVELRQWAEDLAAHLRA